MPVLGLVLVALSIAGGTYAILVTVRRRRTPPELRGDWWSEFERDFRAYASQAGAERRRRRHRGEPA